MTYLAAYIAYALVFTALLQKRGVRKIHSEKKLEAFEPIDVKSVLVFGASGRTGKQIVDQALEKGLLVTAFVRDPARLQLSHPNLCVAVGDVLDYDSVEKAMVGQDAILCALGHNKFLGPRYILSQGMRNIIKAMQTLKVKRIILESSIGVGDSVGQSGIINALFTIPIILPFYFWDKAKQESILASSPLAWSIVRPASLTNGEKTEDIRTDISFRDYILPSSISRADVAHFMLGEIENSSSTFKAVRISR